MLARARERGIREIICIGTSHEDSLAARDFAAAHEDVYWTYGIHPESSDSDWSNIFSDGRPRARSFSQHFTQSSPRSSRQLTQPTASLGDSTRLGRGKVDKNDTGSAGELSEKILSPIAIGEVGLDYHYEGYNREAQIRLFEEMLQLAVDNDLPVSFHVREAFDDFFAVVANFPSVRGVVHSFTDSKKKLKRILNETDFYVGVNGLATYSTLPLPPLERILLETDAPFLTPVPFRGIINEPGYVREVAEWLAAKLALKPEIIGRETSKNARKLFNFRDPVLCES